MHFKKGTDRYVLTVPVLGIVIKFARLRIIHFVVNGCGSVFNWKTRIIFVYDCKRMYFRGLVANWSEFVFWLSSRHVFLQPTYLSLFGLINIQKFGQPLVMDDINFLKQIQYYTKWFCWEDCHTMLNNRNYVLDHKDKIHIVDYGNPQVQMVVIRFGMECHRKFRVDYDRTKDALIGEDTANQEWGHFREERRKRKATDI